MNEKKLYQVLKGPHTTEKSTQVGEKYRQIVFKVAPTATKQTIKIAVERLFKVTVEAVRVCNVRGKVKRFKQREGRQKDKKKAYVTLKDGCDIQFADFE